MKHDWEHINGGIKDLGTYGRRKCKNCGAEQAKYPQGVWMRTTSYRWEPLVGKCKIEQKKG